MTLPDNIVKYSIIFGVLGVSTYYIFTEESLLAALIFSFGGFALLLFPPIIILLIKTALARSRRKLIQCIVVWVLLISLPFISQLVAQLMNMSGLINLEDSFGNNIRYLVTIFVLAILFPLIFAFS